MTGPQHYREAERLLLQATDAPTPVKTALGALAQANATLALAAATALKPQGGIAPRDYEEWVEAAGGDGDE